MPEHVSLPGSFCRTLGAAERLPAVQALVAEQLRFKREALCRTVDTGRARPVCVRTCPRAGLLGEASPHSQEKGIGPLMQQLVRLQVGLYAGVACHSRGHGKGLRQVQARWLRSCP